MKGDGDCTPYETFEISSLFSDIRYNELYTINGKWVSLTERRPKWDLLQKMKLRSLSSIGNIKSIHFKHLQLHFFTLLQ